MVHKKYRFLIFGGKGWIGQQFIQYIPKEIEYTISPFRIDSNVTLSTLKSTIQSFKPTHVICFIGRTHGYVQDKYISTIDYLEHEGKLRENVQDNLYAPVLLAMTCQLLNIHLTYMGTGCIFHRNEKEDLFTEKDVPNFYGSSYSTVKGFTDTFMKSFEHSVLNVRIRMPITDMPHPRNFITKIVSYDKICSLANSMTVLPELLPYLIQMMIDHKTGTINFTNPGSITHNEILELYREIVNPQFTWTNFTLEEQSQILLSQRSNNSLDTHHLKEWFPEVLSIQESVRKCLLEYKKYVQTILVTGGCGFIGSHFINHIMTHYPYMHIINMDAMYYCASESNIELRFRQSPQYLLIRENICQAEKVAEILRSKNVNVVLHFAAQSHVQNSFSNSLLFTRDNVLGTHTLLEECRKYNQLERFIHISTDEVYGESSLDEDPKKEQSILCPTNPYAATKASAELIAKSYYFSFQLPLIITRSSNIFGLHQYAEKVIPAFIQQLKQGQKLTIQGDGSSIRAFLYVKDIVTAIELILLKGHLGETYNIGSEEEYSVLDIAKKLISLEYPDSTDIQDYIEYIEDRPFNDKRYYITNSKIKELGWTPKYTFEQGLEEIWNFHHS